LAWYAVRHWDEFFGRSLQVNVIAPEQFTGAAQSGGVGEAVLRTLGMFSFEGDPAWKYNLGGQPVFDWPVSLLFYAGLVVAVIGIFRRGAAESDGLPGRANPHMFALLTVVLMLIPGFVSAEAPHFLRTIGVLPLLYAFPALALDWLIARVPVRWALAGVAGAGVLLVGEGVETGYRYFETWATSPAAYYGMQAEAAGVAAD
jgi:hypothetical protein